MQPFTIEHFEKYTSRLVLDSGDAWKLEEFQGIAAEPMLEAARRRMEGLDHGGWELWTILPEGNAKTTLLAGVALYLADYCPMPWIPVGASSRDQAEILAKQAYQMIRASPGMLSRFKIYEGYRRIQPIREGHPGHGDRGIVVHAADVGTNDGVIPFPLSITDEGHRHPDLGLYRLWRGKSRKRGASIAMISTAGTPGSEFEVTRDSIRDSLEVREQNGAHLHGRAGKVILNEWKVPRVDQINDMAIVKDANPLSIITEETLAEDYDSPTMDVGDWTRLKCNISARTTSAAVAEIEWDDAAFEDRLPEMGHVDLGIDVAWRHDTFAMQPMFAGKSLRLLLDPKILTPPRDGSTLHPDTAKAAFDDLCDRYPIEARKSTIVMDLSRAEDLAAWFEDERGMRVFDWSQGNAQAAKDYEEFMKGLRNGKLKHTGSSLLRSHVMNAISRALPGDRRRFDRPSQSRGAKRQEERVIDCLTAAAMVNSWAATPPKIKVGDYRIEKL